MTIILAIASLGGLTLLLAIALVVANRKFAVYEDPRIDTVEEMLPHANCGACGLPGCRPFAEELVAGKVAPANCTVSSPEARTAIAEYMGIDAGSVEKKVARLACAGGKNVATEQTFYTGVSSCKGASLLSGGGKSCFWGCLGYGDCEVSCDFEAIRMNDQSIPVVDENLCTACGDCVVACPKDLFSIQPVSHQLWVACKSLDTGDEVLADCEVGCTACGKCAMDAPGMISMENNLPIINYDAGQQIKAPIERCPTGAIIWWDKTLGAIRGKESKAIIRKSPRKIQTS